MGDMPHREQTKADTPMKVPPRPPLEPRPAGGDQAMTAMATTRGPRGAPLQSRVLLFPSRNGTIKLENFQTL